MDQGIQDWTKYNLWKTAFKKFEETISLQIFKDCLPQILLSPFWNTLTQIWFCNLANARKYTLIKLFQNTHGCFPFREL